MGVTAVFIDGGAFFDGLHAQGFSLDLDYRALLACIAGVDPGDLGAIRFYIAPFPEGPYPNKSKAHESFFELLAEQGVIVVKGITEVRDGIFVERNVEAALATDLVAGAFRKDFEEALILSRREAFAPAVSVLRELGLVVKAAFFSYGFDPTNGIADAACSFRKISSQDIISYTRRGTVPKGVHGESVQVQNKKA